MRNRYILPIIAILALAATSLTAQTSTALLTTLHPYPKAAFARAGNFGISPGIKIVLPANPDPAATAAAAYLQRLVKEQMGFAPETIDRSLYDGGRAIVIGIGINDLQFARGITPMPRGETMPGAGGYILDITSDHAIIIGADGDGAFNAISTLTQLMVPGDVTAFVACAHIWDYPDYPVRWVFSQHNLRGPGQLEALRRIEDTMAYYKLNGLQQNDFKYSLLDQQPAYYFDSVRALAEHSRERNIGIIPGVAPIGYSEGILWNDRQLAEGFPATARFVVAGDTARIIPDPNVTLPNGEFESVGSNGKFTGWTFYDDGAVSVEKSGVHRGENAARCENFTNGNPAGNCRFSRRVDCQPYRAYRLSAWLKTENLSADMIQLLAIGQDDNGGSRVLTFTQFPTYRNQSTWRQLEVYFNTLGYNHVILYAGVWGGRSGKIWWDDIAVEDAGLMDILRREGTPLTVRNAGSGALYKEGTDFAPLRDPFIDNPGNPYGRYHQPPTLHRLASGGIRNGDTLAISWFHPLTTIVGDDGNGSVMVCVSEDTLYTILRDQIRGVDSLYHSLNVSMGDTDRFFMGHDEIRSLGWDSACTRRNLSAAELLADNVRRCNDIIEDVRPGAANYVWSDMFDSLHNAHKDYYLINGDLTGIWNMIPKELTIVNWNGGKMRASLDKFSSLGFRQVTSPYYDEQGTSNMRAWRRAMEGVKGVDGMMYTTWAADYAYLKPFAYYAWGAGPYLIHEPIDTTALPGTVGTRGTVCFQVTALSDPYDPADSIGEITVTIHASRGGDLPEIHQITLTRDSGNVYSGCDSAIPWHGFSYQITATNAQGLRRELPLYDVFRAGLVGVEREPAAPEMIDLAVEPNPAAAATSLAFTLRSGGRWTLRVIDLLGHEVLTRSGEALAGRQHLSLDLASLPTGLYRCELVTATERGSEMVRVVR